MRKRRRFTAAIEVVALPLATVLVARNEDEGPSGQVETDPEAETERLWAEVTRFVQLDQLPVALEARRIALPLRSPKGVSRWTASLLPCATRHTSHAPL